MDKTFLIRLKGKTQGPFDAEKLRMMTRRGQFSRAHEVSDDLGKTWRNAGDVADLFKQPQAPIPGETVANSENNGAPPSNAAVWFYGRNGQPVGPIDFNTLVNRAARGEINASTSVFKDAT